jgi:Carboxypeptidase regulatory-like domain
MSTGKAMSTSDCKLRLLALMLAAFLANGFFFSLPLGAQTTFGSITGTVTDTSGAVIPNAAITVTNEATGAVRNVVTSNPGAFNVPDLGVGSYKIHIEAPGFKPYDQADMTLNANQVLGLDVRLAVSSATTTVEIAGIAPVIDTETSTLAYPKDNSFMEQLPTVSRTAADVGVFGYAYTNPGVQKGGMGDPDVNGNRMLDTLLTLDGIQVNAYVSGIGGGPTQPSLEAIQQVNVDVAGTQAEFGRAANITVITKSGTNSFHGDVYYDWNGDDLNARDFFSSTVPFRVYNNFAAALGGPIKKDKLFFFVTYDGSRESAYTVATGNVPLVPWRTGNFAGLSQSVIDPTTGAPFPNNIIPASRISPVATAVENFYYPLPNFGGPTLQTNNWRGQGASNTAYDHYDAYSGRFDYDLSSKDTITARYNFRKSLRTYFQWPAGDTDEYRPTDAGLISWVHIFSPTVLNELRGGFIYNYDSYTPTEIGYNVLHQVGITGVGTNSIPDAPAFVITGLSSTNSIPTLAGGSSIGGTSFYNAGIETNFQFTDNLSITRGSHSLKFGADEVHDRLDGWDQANTVDGGYNFTGTYTGLGMADFLLGIPQTTQLAVPAPNFYLHEDMISAYAQDQWIVNPKLTLTYGIRYEIQKPYHDIYGNIFNYDPALKAVVVPDSGISHVNPLYPSNLAIVSASTAGYSNSLLASSYDHFYPRVGFAYKITNKTVLRGGWGLYDDNIYAAVALNDLRGGPFAGSETFTNKLTNGVPLFSFPDPFTAVGGLPTENTTGINPNLRQPYTQEYTMMLQQQLGRIALNVAYVGNKSTALVYERNLNQPMPSLIPYTAARAYNNSLYNTIDYLDNGGTSNYNSLQISAVGRIGKNLTLNNGFAWTKDLSDDSASSNANGAQIQNQFCLSCEYGPSPYTRKLRAYVNLVWALPVGRGQRFLSHGRIANAVLGGWSTSAISEMETGSYLTPSFTGFDVSNTNTIGGRPDVIGNPFANVPAGLPFNPAAFAVPGCPATNPLCTNPAPVGRFGDAGVGILEGPHVINWNMALAKTFQVRERMDLRFRALATNVFNHPNFSSYATNISSPSTFGISSSTFGEQLGENDRTINLSLRLQF